MYSCNTSTNTTLASKENHLKDVQAEQSQPLLHTTPCKVSTSYTFDRSDVQITPPLITTNVTTSAQTTPHTTLEINTLRCLPTTKNQSASSMVSSTIQPSNVDQLRTPNIGQDLPSHSTMIGSLKSTDVTKKNRQRKQKKMIKISYIFREIVF